jgi:siroheme synthase-like protein
VPVDAPLYPVGLVVAGRAVLVVGGGRVAARKAGDLVACGARVTVVAPEVVPVLAERAEVTVERRPYRAGEAAGYRLVVTATGDRAVDQQVYDDAEAAGVWVNSADDPERCTFTLPAVVRRDPVVVAMAPGATARRWRRGCGAACPTSSDPRWRSSPASSARPGPG